MPVPSIISIDYLSDQECKIYRWTNSLLNGTRNEKDLIFKNEAEIDYKKIQLYYFDILIQSEHEFIKLEVLKRLTFLNWIFMLEPDFFTGIIELDESTVFNSYEILDIYIRKDKLDDELTWMLKYYSAWEYIIYNHSEGRLDALTTFAKSADTSESGLPRRKLPKGTMDNRGQMGIYWKQHVEEIY